MWLRYWLASGGIHPDKDISLITIPPPQMVANIKINKMDGFCVCAFTEEFANRNPKTVKAVLKALHLSSQHIAQYEQPSIRG